MTGVLPTFSLPYFLIRESPVHHDPVVGFNLAAVDEERQILFVWDENKVSSKAML